MGSKGVEAARCGWRGGKTRWQRWVGPLTLLSAPSPAPTKALPPQGAALPTKKSSPRVDTSVYLAAGLVCGTSSCTPGQHAALVLPSLSLGLLSDHDKMINTVATSSDYFRSKLGGTWANSSPRNPAKSQLQWTPEMPVVLKLRHASESRGRWRADLAKTQIAEPHPQRF